MNRWNVVNNGLARNVLSYLLVASTVFVGLPFYTIGQVSKNDDLSRSGDKVALGKKTQPKTNKMDGGTNLTEAKVAAAAASTGVVSAKNASGADVSYSVLNVEFKTPVARKLVFTDLKQSKLAGATVITVIDRFADIFVDSDAAWDALAANPNVLRVEFSTRVEAPPPPEVTPSALISQAPPELIVRGGYRGLTGKGTIIAVLDTGIDFRHPDFITYDAAGTPTSRIAYFWDTATDYQSGRGSMAPFKFPNGSSIGTLYTRQQLTSELRSSTANIPPTDLDGHGTACASVAAGNGNADKMASGLKRNEVVGVAPEADIIGVRLGHDGLENSYLLNAICEWLDKVAGKTPLVVSGSFGGHYSGHDGQRVQERELNARFLLTRAGRAVVFAAGNEGNDPIHATINFSTPSKLVSWTAAQKTIVKMYFDSADPNIVIYGTKATSISPGLYQEINPITNQLEARLTVEPGLGGVWFENTSGKASTVHLYMMSDQLGTFSPEYVVASHLVGSPGAMENAITVGSYDWNDNFHAGGHMTNLSSVCRDASGNRMPFEIGWLSCYSSPGPSRSGSVKPDIAAPGEWYPSADAKDNGHSAGDWARPDTTGYYRAMNGTSAATPYTSGVVALIFEKKPLLTLGELKALLKGKASKTGLNPYSTGIPNNNWGYGKLDEAALDRIFASL
jgi:subtilisin family serine protease